MDVQVSRGFIAPWSVALFVSLQEDKSQDFMSLVLPVLLFGCETWTEMSETVGQDLTPSVTGLFKEFLTIAGQTLCVISIC